MCRRAFSSCWLSLSVRERRLPEIRPLAFEPEAPVGSAPLVLASTLLRLYQRRRYRICYKMAKTKAAKWNYCPESIADGLNFTIVAIVPIISTHLRKNFNFIHRSQDHINTPSISTKSTTQTRLAISLAIVRGRLCVFRQKPPVLTSRCLSSDA